MAREWQKRTVAELQAAGAILVEDGNHGENRPRPDEFSAEGIQFIRAADMDCGRVLFESAQRINEVARQRVRKGIGAGGDVLLSHKGTVGKVAYVPLDAPPFVCSPQTTFWRAKDPKQIDRRFIYYFLLSRGFREQLDSRKGETDMADYVSLTTQRTLKVTVPPIPEQKAIAHILGTLDDKIELNRRMNATLEAMARALFKSWFVDFDPVRAKLDGRKPERMDAATAALFPARFQESSLGLIPWGWSVMAVADIATRIAMGPFGSRITRDNFVPTGVPVVRGGNLSDGFVDDDFVFLTEGKADELKSAIAHSLDIVLTHRGTLGQVGIIPIKARHSRYVVSQSQMLLSIDRNKASPWMVYLFFRSTLGESALLANTSTTGVPAISRPTTSLKAIRVVVPPTDVLARFDDFIQPLFLTREQNALQSRTLITLRDTLLPKLLSGELRVAADGTVKGFNHA